MIWLLAAERLRCGHTSAELQGETIWSSRADSLAYAMIYTGLILGTMRLAEWKRDG